MSKGIHLDAIDIHILKILARDCTVGTRTISEEVGISQPMVRRRIKRMKSLGLIRGCKADIDPSVAGALTYLIIFEGMPEGRLEDLKREFWEIERIYYSTARKVGALIARIIDLKSADEIARWLEERGLKVNSTTLIDVEYGEGPWVPEKPRERVQPRCAFCKMVIVGEPIRAELDDGTTLYFCSHECETAYFKLVHMHHGHAHHHQM
ncbi:MAG: AsnC family transcriptional regulator [Aeropyrum sp.]|nr:AsnC family transcriptional regulator [Aeropyrum sp.]MCE4616772.1 AsnC family transcriptional regulator [Aeropyrum sp.]